MISKLEWNIKAIDKIKTIPPNYGQQIQIIPDDKMDQTTNNLKVCKKKLQCRVNK